MEREAEKKRDRKNEQGTGSLAVATGSRHGTDRHFGERKEPENSAVGRALSRTVIEPSCCGAGGGGGEGAGHTGGFDGVMQLRYGTTTAD